MEIEPAILSTCPEDLDAAMVFLRQAGLSKIGSIKALHDRFGLSLAEAKTAAHCSTVWVDRRDADDAFHRELLEARTTGASRAS